MKQLWTGLLGVFLALSSQAVLDAQEGESDLVLIPRVSSVSGDLDDTLDMGYEDLWDAGVGLTIETDLLFPVGPRWSMGGYLALGFDVFGGDTFTDELGDTLEADDLFTSHFMLGFKAMLAPEKGFYFDGRIGLGLVSYAETEGELTLSGVPSDVTIFDATTVFAAEVAVHVGYSARRFFMAAGFAGRTQGAPDEADLDFDGTSAAAVGSFEVEIGFRF